MTVSWPTRSCKSRPASCSIDGPERPTVILGIDRSSAGSSAPGTLAAASSLSRGGPRIATRTGRKAPATNERGCGTQATDHRDDYEPAQAEGQDPEHLDDPENAREHLVRHRALDESEEGDVEYRVACTDDGQQHQRECVVRPYPDQRQRQPPEHDAEDERRGQPRRRPASARAANDPIRAPTPKAEFRNPTPDSPTSSKSRARTTSRTEFAPATKVCAEKRLRRTPQSRVPRNRTEARERFREEVCALRYRRRARQRWESRDDR